MEVVADREQPLVQLGAPIHPYGISVSTKKIDIDYLNIVKYVSEFYIREWCKNWILKINHMDYGIITSQKPKSYRSLLAKPELFLLRFYTDIIKELPELQSCAFHNPRTC